MRQRVIATVGVLALIGLVFALNFYRLPVVALSPGPMEDVLARLKVEGSRVYDSEGKLYLTSVGIDDNVRFYEALLDMANRDVQLLPRAQLYPDTEDSSEIDKENAALMDRSKETATVVALRKVGYHIEPSGVEVTQVVSGAPADGKLLAGDRIVAADGHAVASIDQVRKAINRHRAGERVAFRVDRGRAQKDRILTGYCTPAFVEMEAADCAMLLGQPHEAVVTFQHGLASLPGEYQRDRAVNLARLAVAYAASREPELACAVAQEAAAIVASTWSARAVAELRRLPTLLSGWPDSAAAAELEATLAALP